MTHPVQTVTAETLQDLEMRVQLEIAKGWIKVGNPGPLLIGGQPDPNRAKFTQIMERK